MGGISTKAKSFYGKVNTLHTKWRLRNGDIVDLGSENVTDGELTTLALECPELFELKPVQVAPKTNKESIS